ncbi:hypothetical protein F4811DRAFT_551155 [Daldinia bambusicola]|nr:hypothetical protein F4811DRAFT_551155 [Daldinia bambusicola]
MRLFISALAFAACSAALPLEARNSTLTSLTTDVSFSDSDDISLSKSYDFAGNSIEEDLRALKMALQHTDQLMGHSNLPRCVNAIMPNGGFHTAADGEPSVLGAGDISTAALAVAVAVLVML